MTILSTEHSELIRKAVARVVAAFETVPYPGDDVIVHKKLYRDFEKEQIAEFLRGRDWRDLNVKVLDEEYVGDASAILTFLTAQAFQYYLPGFLIVCLKEYNEADVIPWSVFRKFEKPIDEGLEMANYYAERISLVNREQLHATHESLKAILSVYGSDSWLEVSEAALAERCGSSDAAQ